MSKKQQKQEADQEKIQQNKEQEKREESSFLAPWMGVFEWEFYRQFQIRKILICLIFLLLI
ncbi:MAG: hypothetical protein D6785_15160, partial [Planctomycetota bacterium]